MSHLKMRNLLGVITMLYIWAALMVLFVMAILHWLYPGPGGRVP